MKFSNKVFMAVLIALAMSVPSSADSFASRTTVSIDGGLGSLTEAFQFKPESNVVIVDPIGKNYTSRSVNGSFGFVVNPKFSLSLEFGRYGFDKPMGVDLVDGREVLNPDRKLLDTGATTHRGQFLVGYAAKPWLTVHAGVLTAEVSRHKDSSPEGWSWTKDTISSFWGPTVGVSVSKRMKSFTLDARLEGAMLRRSDREEIRYSWSSSASVENGSRSAAYAVRPQATVTWHAHRKVGFQARYAIERVHSFRPETFSFAQQNLGDQNFQANGFRFGIVVTP